MKKTDKCVCLHECSCDGCDAIIHLQDTSRHTHDTLQEEETAPGDHATNFRHQPPFQARHHQTRIDQEATGEATATATERAPLTADTDGGGLEDGEGMRVGMPMMMLMVVLIIIIIIIVINIIIIVIVIHYYYCYYYY